MQCVYFFFGGILFVLKRFGALFLSFFEFLIFRGEMAVDDRLKVRKIVDSALDEAVVGMALEVGVKFFKGIIKLFLTSALL